MKPEPFPTGLAVAKGGRYRKLRFLLRLRYQLLGGVLFGLVVPYLLRHGADVRPVGSANVVNTATATFVGLAVGLFLTRRMSGFPGVAAISTVIPAFAFAFGLPLAWVFFFRVEYSGFLFGAGFTLVLAWFCAIALIEPVLRRPLLLIVPFGRALALTNTSGADWRVAKDALKLPTDVTGVVADFRADLPDAWEQFLARAALAGLPVYHWKQASEALTGTVDIDHLSENTFGSLIPSLGYVRVKDLLDNIAALVLLPAIGLVCLVVAAVILVVDGRPVLYRQPRIGFRGRRFTMYKFRTMQVGAERGSGITEENDPRVTRLGRCLRHFRIDELPQVINILKGDMSWIGPRPESEYLSKWYESKVPFYSYRHIVRPGITGWAQVHQGNVGEIKAATDKLRYDFYYIKHFSPWLDILITAKTIRVMLTGFGSR